MQTLHLEYCIKYNTIDDYEMFKNACNVFNLDIRKENDVVKNEKCWYSTIKIKWYFIACQNISSYFCMTISLSRLISREISLLFIVKVVSNIKEKSRIEYEKWKCVEMNCAQQTKIDSSRNVIESTFISCRWTTTFIACDTQSYQQFDYRRLQL